MYAVFYYMKKNYLMVCFILGVLLGIVYFLDLSNKYVEQLETYSLYYSNKFLNLKTMNLNLFLDIFFRRIKEMMFVYLVGYTSFKNIFNCGYCCFLGFCNCIYIYMATVNYGLMGIVVYFFSIFPQCIILIPLTAYVVKNGGSIKGFRKTGNVALIIAALCILETIIEVEICYNLFALVIKYLYNG